MTDPLAEFKAKQREGWAAFTPVEVMTTPPAARLVRFAGVKAGQRVLDVGCGTGVVALTARRLGAKVTGLDLTPELLSRAKENAAATGYDDVEWREGDAEDLPFPDASFDVVLSQFGHMFAPRPDVTVRQMLRVLRPGGTIAFSTWPPEVAMGRILAAIAKYAPPPPPGVSPPSQWGDVGIVRQRLGDAVKDLRFDRDLMRFATLSPAHYRANREAHSGPIRNLVRSLQGRDPAKLAQFRAELEGVAAEYFEPTENVIRMEFLMTRATKA